MLLQQLVSIFLCSQFPASSDVHHTLGLRCGLGICKEFLQCQSPSKATCSCFLHREAKTFMCPREMFLVTESGTSSLSEAMRFSCYSFGPHMSADVPLTPPIHPGNSVIIMGVLTPCKAWTNFSILTGEAKCLDMKIECDQKRFTSSNGLKDVHTARSFPFKLGTFFEVNLVFRQDGYEVFVDEERIFTNVLSLNCTLEVMNTLSLVVNVSIFSVFLDYNW